jgi:hypothetical protein
MSQPRTAFASVAMIAVTWLRDPNHNLGFAGSMQSKPGAVAKLRLLYFSFALKSKHQGLPDL